MDPVFDMKEFIGLVAVILSLGLPIVVIVMVFLKKMKKDQQQKEIRQLIIENKTDPETAKLLIDEPKKAPKPGTIDVGNLRFACMMLGIGLGAGINWLADISTKNIYFWLIIAFGVGIGMLCSFLVEMHLAKKQYPTEDNWKDE
jgi:hypothetical protein